MKLFNKLPVQQVKDMFKIILETPATLYASFFLSALAIAHFVFIVFLIRELIQVLKGMRTDGKNKTDAIKKIVALGQKQEELKHQIQHVEQQITRLEQQLQEQCQQQEEKEMSDSARDDSLRSRMYILDRFREDSFRWSKLQQDQELLTRTLSEATNKVSNRVSKLEIKYTTAIRDLEKRLTKMDRIVADNFNVVTKYTEKIDNYCKEDEEESNKMAEALFALQDQVNEELGAYQSQIKDLEHKLARLQSANWPSTCPTTKGRAAPESKDMDPKSKRADIAKNVSFLESTSMGAKSIKKPILFYNYEKEEEEEQRHTSE